MKATIALAVRSENEDFRVLEILSDSREISLLESAISQKDDHPLQRIYEHRERQSREDEDFSDYVEELLSNPFLKSDIQKHGVQWLKSKIRIEQFQQSENEAARVIAEYAMTVFRSNPKRMDFTLAGPSAEVRIRIFILNDSLEGASQAA